MDKSADIVFIELKVGILEMVLNIFQVTCDEIIHTNDTVSFIYKPVTQV